MADSLRRIYYGRYIMADILRHTYIYIEITAYIPYSRHMMADKHHSNYIKAMAAMMLRRIYIYVYCGGYITTDTL